DLVHADLIPGGVAAVGVLHAHAGLGGHVVAAGRAVVEAAVAATGRRRRRLTGVAGRRRLARLAHAPAGATVERLHGRGADLLPAGLAAERDLGAHARLDGRVVAAGLGPAHAAVLAERRRTGVVGILARLERAATRAAAELVHERGAGARPRVAAAGDLVAHAGLDRGVVAARLTVTDAAAAHHPLGVHAKGGLASTGGPLPRPRRTG